MNTSSDSVRLVEVGPRDGLQNEQQLVPTATKVELIQRLAACGHRSIEATSFVSPKWIPQLADAAEVFSAVATLPDRHPGLSLPVLVPNLTGLQRALAVGVKEIAVFTAASEAFNRRNINASIDESLARFEPVLAQARDEGLRVRGYVSTVLGCPYQGEVPIADVVRVTRALFRAGCYEISLGDTIGVGTPRAAANLFAACAAEVPASALAVHFHDTWGQALANLLACLEIGARVIDCSVAGLGGCPYAQGATGNVASEDVVYLLHGMGLDTGVDLASLAATGAWISSQLQRQNQSRAGRAMMARTAVHENDV